MKERKCILFIIVFFSVIIICNISSAKRLENNWALVYSPSFSMFYDNNVFKYSSDRIDQFVDGKGVERFKAVETYDDLIFSQENKCYLSKRYNKDHRTRLRLHFEQKNYLKNRQKNYYTYSIYIRHYLYDGYLQVGYVTIPEYHIRHIWDEDSDDFESCDFEKRLVSMKGTYETFWDVYLSLYYKYQENDYNEFFDEYDTDIDIIESRLSRKLTDNITLRLFYMYSDAVAKAYDEPDENAMSSDDSDISYEEDGFGGEIEFELDEIKSRPVEIEVGFEYYDRVFTTDKTPSEDPYHSSRIDKIYELNMVGNTEISSRWDLLIGYEFSQRTVSSDYKQYIEDVKNYKKNRIYISAGFHY